MHGIEDVCGSCLSESEVGQVLGDPQPTPEHLPHGPHAAIIRPCRPVSTPCLELLCQPVVSPGPVQALLVSLTPASSAAAFLSLDPSFSVCLVPWPASCLVLRLWLPSPASTTPPHGPAHEQKNNGHGAYREAEGSFRSQEQIRDQNPVLATWPEFSLPGFKPLFPRVSLLQQRKHEGPGNRAMCFEWQLFLIVFWVHKKVGNACFVQVRATELSGSLSTCAEQDPSPGAGGGGPPPCTVLWSRSGPPGLV